MIERYSVDSIARSPSYHIRWVLPRQARFGYLPGPESLLNNVLVGSNCCFTQAVAPSPCQCHISVILKAPLHRVTAELIKMGQTTVMARQSGFLTNLEPVTGHVYTQNVFVELHRIMSENIHSNHVGFQLST